MRAKIFSATIVGLETYLVEIEVDISRGRPRIHIVGLAGVAIQESKKRIESSMRHINQLLPEATITLNLAPADLKKVGTGFDLPMAVAILHAITAVRITDKFLNETIFCGELGLDGSLKSVNGIFSIALDAKKMGKKRIVIPSSSEFTHTIDSLEVICVSNLSDLIKFFKGDIGITPLKKGSPPRVINTTYDFSDIQGQYQAKRALQIAAAGYHHTIFMGPPGSGKTMLANRLIGIMPSMSFTEMVETTRIYSASGMLSRNELLIDRPFRNPHHTISYAGLVGGGSTITPGEVTLGHNGVLFLDEITEFSKKTLEVMRQPLEDKKVTIARASASISYPADFLLIAAFNPCPCGFSGDGTKRCACSKIIVESYLKKLSGPFLDRIDIQLSLHAVKYEDTIKDSSFNKTSAQMYGEIESAIDIQKKRGVKNGHMAIKHVQQYCKTTPAAEEVIKKAFDKLNLSMRGYHKILKVSRTIADIAGKEFIEDTHIKEALSYRQIDQKLANIMYL